MDQRFVKPAEGRLVRDPATGQPIPAEGALVEWTSFFRRRLAEGDITEAKAPTVPRQPKPARVVGATTAKETEQ